VGEIEPKTSTTGIFGREVKMMKECVTTHRPHWLKGLTTLPGKSGDRRLSGDPPKGKEVVDDGAELIDSILAVNQSDTLKTVVDGVEKFSQALQNLVTRIAQRNDIYILTMEAGSHPDHTLLY